MPLPSALLQKLQKRGIVSSKGVPKAKNKDYKGYQFCPNKSNVHHICTSWCENNWKGYASPDPIYLRNIQKLLFKYPLPHNWTEVFDKSVGRYYYWNMENDLVSWLPPKHPLAKTSKSAAKLREKLESTFSDIKEDKNDERSADDKDFKKPSSRSHKRDSDKDDRHRKDERDKYSYKKKRPDILDPMDPASYSDIAPGTWADGLENNRSSADNTASGVLYQQRPYPSPGEVLSNNKDKHRDKKR